nr:MAG TPA: hypothetical protein [Caudoviricetes sp.]
MTRYGCSSSGLVYRGLRAKPRRFLTLRSHSRRGSVCPRIKRPGYGEPGLGYGRQYRSPEHRRKRLAHWPHPLS